MAIYTDKVIVLTGASQGIGKALAIALSPQRPRLVLAARDELALQAVEAQCQALGAKTFVFRTDVTDEAQCRDLIRRTVETAGGIDVLIHNAGGGMNARFDAMTDISVFEKLMRLNYLGPVYLTHEALPHLKKSRGQIVCVSSVAGLTGVPLRTAYSASKHALEAVSEALAQEVKPFNIRVAIVEPGIIDTEMAQNIGTGGNSIYPQVNRFGGLFIASLKTPTQATLVANKMLEIANSDNWQLRHPVGPDAAPFLGWRASMTDEQWVDWNAANDEDWYNAVESTFGLNVRKEQ